MAAAAVAMVADAPRISVAEVADTAAEATAAEDVAMVAVAADAPASFLAAAAAAEVAAEVIGVGLMACGPGVLATITAIRPANSLPLLNARSQCAVRRGLAMVVKLSVLVTATAVG